MYWPQVLLSVSVYVYVGQSGLGWKGLLPYTELTEDHVQHVFDVNHAGDLAYGLGSIS